MPKPRRQRLPDLCRDGLINRHSGTQTMNAVKALPRRRGGTLRRLGWLSATAMLAVSALAPASSYAATGNLVNSISVPSCFEGGMSGTLDVTVVSSPFVFDIFVTDHLPGGGDWVEI